MDKTEPAGWVRQFTDQIAGERDPAWVAVLLKEFEQVTAHEIRRLRESTAYRLRTAGYSTEQVAMALGVERHTSTGWARRYARGNALPWPPMTRGPDPRSVIDLQT